MINVLIAIVFIILWLVIGIASTSFIIMSLDMITELYYSPEKKYTKLLNFNIYPNIIQKLCIIVGIGMGPITLIVGALNFVLINFIYHFYSVSRSLFSKKNKK